MKAGFYLGSTIPELAISAIKIKKKTLEIQDGEPLEWYFKI